MVWRQVLIIGGDGGQATSAVLGMPLGVGMDGAGNMYIADRLNKRARRMTPACIISTINGIDMASFIENGYTATLKCA